MRQMIGKLAWRVMKWSFRLMTEEKDILYAYVPLPPGFHFDVIEDVTMGDFSAKAVKLVRDGVQIEAPAAAAPGSGGYF